jgi:hypothetical protein
MHGLTRSKNTLHSCIAYNIFLVYTYKQEPISQDPELGFM